jgi:hypothetical protein
MAGESVPEEIGFSAIGADTKTTVRRRARRGYGVQPRRESRARGRTFPHSGPGESEIGTPGSKVDDPQPMQIHALCFTWRCAFGSATGLKQTFRLQ